LWCRDLGSRAKGLHQRLDDLLGGERAQCLVVEARERLSGRHLLRRLLRVGVEVEVHPLEWLAADATLSHEAEERVVDPNPQHLLQLGMGAADGALADLNGGGLLESPETRKADVLEVPETITVEVGDVGEREVAPGMRVAREVAESREISKQASRRTVCELRLQCPHVSDFFSAEELA